MLNSQKEGPEGGGAGPAVPGATRRSNPISAGLVSCTSLRALAQAAGADIWEGEGRVQGAGSKVVKCQWNLQAADNLSGNWRRRKES